MKTPLTSLLLVSTAILAASAHAQSGAEQKPSVEMHLEALESLQPSSAAQSNAAPTTPQRIISRSSRVPLNQVISASRSQQAYKPIEQNPRLESTQTLRRHGSILLNSRIQPLAPAPVATAPVIQQPQMVHIAPPYGVQTTRQAPLPAPAPQPVEPAPAFVQEEAPAPQPAAAPEPAPVLAAAPAEKSSSWWDDTTDSIGNLFDTGGQPATAEAPSSDQSIHAVAPEAPTESAQTININTTASTSEAPLEQEPAININAAASAPEAPTLATPPVLQEEPLSVPPVASAEPVPPPTAQAPMLQESASPVNAASYDGLEMAQEFGMQEMPSAMASPPPAVVTLPVPVVKEGEEVVLAQASEEGTESLVDPFASGVQLVPQPTPAEPIAPIVPEAKNNHTNAAMQPPPPAPPAEAPPESAQVTPEATPAVSSQEKEDESSWMGDLKNSLVGYFEEEKKSENEPRPPANQPVFDQAGNLMQDEKQAAAPVAEVQSPAEMPASVKAPTEMSSDEKIVENMIGLGPLTTMPENPQVPPPALSAQDVAVAPAAEAAPQPAPLPPLPVKKEPVAEVQATPPGNLPSLTKLTGDPQVIRETAERRVASNDIPPSPGRKPIQQLAAVPEINRSLNASKLVTEQAKPAHAVPVEQAPEVTVSAKSAEKTPKIKDVPKAQPKLESKKIADAVPAPKKTPAPATAEEAKAVEPVKEEVKAEAPPAPPPPPPAVAEATPEEIPAPPAVPKEAATAEVTPPPPPPAPPVAEAAPGEETPASPAPVEVAAAPAEADSQAKEVELKRAEQETTAVTEPAPATETKVASLPSQESLPATATSSLSLSFTGDAKVLPAGSESQLKPIAETLKSKENVRVNLKAYATDSDSAKAKRIALSRGLTVRNYLIDQGVNPLRINLLPFGNKSAGGNPERVDVELVTVGAL